MAKITVYTISQNNFYQNWTSEFYTSDTVASALMKHFYQGKDLKNFLNASIHDTNNMRLVEELCIRHVDVVIPTALPSEVSTIWPESTIGIAVITVGAFLLLSFLFCLICCLCVCCCREAKEKE